MIGIIVGFVGALLGNIYRTVGWPADAEPMELAVGINLVAATLLLLVVFATSGGVALLDLFKVPAAALAQVLGATAMFTVFFRLQQVGGPTYLSQIGYVAATLALLVGTLLLGERYALVTWFGAAVIAVGLGFSVISQRRGE